MTTCLTAVISCLATLLSDVESVRPVVTFPPGPAARVFDHPAVTQLAAGADRSVLFAASNRAVHRVELGPDGTQVRRLAGLDDAIWSLATTPDGGRVYATTRRPARIIGWDGRSGRRLAEVTDGLAPFEEYVAVWPDPGTLTALSPDGLLKRYDLDLRPRSKPLQLSPGWGVRLFPPGTTEPVTSSGLCDPATGALLWRWPDGPMSDALDFYRMTASSDGRFLSSAVRFGRIPLIERVTGQLVRHILGSRSADPAAGTDGHDNRQVFLGRCDTLLVSGHLKGRLDIHPVYRQGSPTSVCLPGGGSVASLCRLDAHTVAVGTTDGQLLLVELRRGRSPFGPSERPSADPARDLRVLFGPDAPAGYARVPALVLAGDRTVAALKRWLPPEPVVPPADIVAAIGRLGDPQFAARDAAARWLREVGDQALGPVLAAKSADPEARRALDRLAGELVRYTPAHATVSRACHVLALIGTPEAVAVLWTLAGGAADDRRTKDAVATLATWAADGPATAPPPAPRTRP